MIGALITQQHVQAFAINRNFNCETKNMSPVVMIISGSDHYCGHALMPGLRSPEAS
jgi:hypothetical protein